MSSSRARKFTMHVWISVLVVAVPTHVHAHSCYYFINRDPAGPHCGGRQGSTSAEFAKCVACATKALPNEPPSYTHCTTTLIDGACKGILPPEPAGSGTLELTLLSQAAKDRGAVCLDGSPAGYYWRKGKGDDSNNFLLVLNGGGWCVGTTMNDTKTNCAKRAAGKLGSSKTWATHLREDAHGLLQRARLLLEYRVAMGTHERLGQESDVRHLTQELMELIVTKLERLEVEDASD